MDPPVVLAVIGAPHGVRGEVRVKCFGDPASLGAYGPLRLPDGRALTVAVLRPLRDDLVVARFREIADRDAAEALRGQELAVPRAALPEAEEDAFYHADLIGLAALTPGGTVLGTVAAVHDFGAGDLLEVRPESGASVLYPFTRAVVPLVDIANRRLTVVPPADAPAGADA